MKLKYFSHSALHYLTPIDFLLNKVDEKLKIRELKLKKAKELRSNYWQNYKQNSVEVSTQLN